MRVRLLLSLPFVSALFVAQASCEQRATAAEPMAMPVSFESVQALPRRAPDREVRYGDAPSQRVSVWHPTGGAAAPAPVVVLLHGGCWLSEYGVDHVQPLATALAAAGFGVWAPEYRRLGEPGGGWPGTFDDVALAIDLLKDGVDPALDPRRVVLVGHSAGGHLALWAAARGAFTPSHPQYREAPLVPGGAVGLAAITDLAAYGAEEGSCQRAVARLLGGPPAGREERYLQASPALLPHPVAVVLLQGTADAIVPSSQARAMPGARIRFVERAGHFDLIHPETPAFGMLLQELRRLLDDA